MADDAAVLAEDLRVRFGATTALDGVSFAVERGTVLGLLSRTARARRRPSVC